MLISPSIRYEHIAVAAHDWQDAQEKMGQTHVTSENENKTERVQLLMSPSELKAIDDWGFSNRIRTRAEAIRRLCQVGLQVEANKEPLTNAAEEASKLVIQLLEWMNATGADEGTPPEGGDLLEISFRMMELMIEASAAASRVEGTQVLVRGESDIDKALALAEAYRASTAADKADR